MAAVAAPAAQPAGLGAIQSSRPATAGWPILIAHRGLALHAPENTLPAFAVCLELGFGLEFDIRTTRDGELVVLHDDLIGRTTNGPNRSVREFTLVELKQFDAGGWFAPGFVGTRVPTLEEVFGLTRQRSRGRTLLALNIKNITRDGEKQLIALLERFGFLDQSFGFDQDVECSRRLKQLSPRFRVGQNVGRDAFETELARGFLDVFMVTFAPTAEQVDRLHERGKLAVYNYGGESVSRRNPEAWSKARQAGIDGMITDFPLECQQHWRLQGGAAR